MKVSLRIIRVFIRSAIGLILIFASSYVAGSQPFTVSKIAEMALPGVVTIGYEVFNRSFGIEGVVYTGSGFILPGCDDSAPLGITAFGGIEWIYVVPFVLTNEHILSPPREISVNIGGRMQTIPVEVRTLLIKFSNTHWRYQGGIIRNVSVVGKYPSEDIAFLFWGEAYKYKYYPGPTFCATRDRPIYGVPGPNVWFILPISIFAGLTVGNSDELKVGESVIAIGSPFGLEGTVTSGIISALHRDVTITMPDGSQRTYQDLIQTDAAINPGNSGGLLLDEWGRVIGVNVIGGRPEAGVTGIAFAIPINKVSVLGSRCEIHVLNPSADLSPAMMTCP